MHTMHEQNDESHGHEGNGYSSGNAYTNGSSAAHGEHGSTGGLGDTMLTVVGMLLPLLAQVGHAH